MGPDDVQDVDPDGTVRQRTVDGIATRFGYDADGRLTRIAPPSDAATSLSYGAHQLVVQQGPQRTTHTLDGWGRPVRTTAAGDHGAETTVFDYDPYGRRSREISALGLATDYTYDVHGRVLRASNNLRQLSYRYEAGSQNRSVTITRNGSVVDLRQQDLAGCTTLSSLNGQAVHTTHQTIRAGGKTIVREVDFFGNLLSETRPERHGTSRFKYDGRGWLEQAQLPGGTVHYRRDGRGRVTEERGADGRQRHFRYHATYNAPVEAKTADVATDLAYDDQGRVRQVTQSFAMASPSGAGRTASAHCAGVPTPTSAPRQVATLHYESLGRLDRFTHPYSGRTQQINYGTGDEAHPPAVQLDRYPVLDHAV